MATTSVMGDIVAEMVGDDARVATVMPTGIDPHAFSPSAQEGVEMRSAEILVTNGAGLEEGLLDTVEAAAADGVTVVEAIDAVEQLGDEDHSDEAGHDHEGIDPHFSSDPARMADAVRALAPQMRAAVPALDTEAFSERSEAYAAELDALDAEIDELLAPIPDDRRVLVTGHAVFDYFADRYDFTVPSDVDLGSTAGGISARDLAELADLVQEARLPAVFVDSSAVDDTARIVAAEAEGDVAVVELFSESLGEEGSGASTYVTMMRTNAQRVADALG